MKNVARQYLPVLAVVLPLFGCGSSSGTGAPSPSGSASASAAPSASAPTTASASAGAPAPTASAAPEPPHDCPTGSTGIGSFTKPCEGKGNTRLMNVTWTKTEDKGPSFKITNKSKLVILYGKIAVYFYDKAGKQLAPVAASGGNGMPDDPNTMAPKTHQYHTCSGSFFQGVMNPNETAVLTFSCVPKSVIPDGTDKIEAEMQTVGFADPTGKKVDFYWHNGDLTPEARSKGGVK